MRLVFGALFFDYVAVVSTFLRIDVKMRRFPHIADQVQPLRQGFSSVSGPALSVLKLHPKITHKTGFDFSRGILYPGGYQKILH